MEGETHVVVYVNAEFRKVSGLGASDVIGRVFADLPRGDKLAGEMQAMPGAELIAMLDLGAPRTRARARRDNLQQRKRTSRDEWLAE